MILVLLLLLLPTVVLSHEFSACRSIFIEFGSGDASDLRKLYEPAHFPSNSSVVALFDRIFGKVRKNVCSFIFEPNPAYGDYLSQLETSYNDAGFRVKTFPLAIRNETKDFIYYCNSRYNSVAWVAFCDHRPTGRKGESNFTVKAIDFATFFASHIADSSEFHDDLKHSTVVVRSNIGDGNDDFTWMHLMAQNVPCKIDYAYGNLISQRVQDNLSVLSKARDCSFKYLHIVDIDSPTPENIPLPVPEYLKWMDTDRMADAIFHAPIPKPPFKLAACVLAYQEGRYLLEWIWYHYLVGFQHFFVYDNNSTDHTDQILEPLVRLGLVTYIPWPLLRYQQPKELGSCFNSSAPKATWMMSHDVDEYVVVAGQAPSVAAILNKEPFVLHRHLDRWKRQGAGALIVGRREFDSNGHLDPPPGLVMREYTSAVYPHTYSVLGGKPLGLMEAIASAWSAHDVNLKRGFKRSNGNNFIAELHDDTRLLRYQPIHLVHYLARSYNECMRKRAEGVRLTGGNGWRNVNNVCNRTMIGMVGYFPRAHYKDTYLVDMRFADIVDGLIAKLKP